MNKNRNDSKRSATLISGNKVFKTLYGLSRYLVFEISRELSLKETLILGGVCKEIHRKVHYKNSSGKYICLRKDNLAHVTSLFLGSCSIQKIGMLLKAGADINAKMYRDQDTSLMWAVYEGKTEMIEFLLENGANPNIQNAYEETALIFAAEKGYKIAIYIVNLLLKNGADVNIQTHSGNTALTIAAKEGNIEIVKILLDNGSDINHQNKDGDTALFLAAGNRRTKVVKFLLDNGADASLENERGYTALMSAAKIMNYGEVVVLLCDEQNERIKKMIRVQHYRNVVDKSRSGFYCIRDGCYRRIKLCPVCDELQRAGAYCDTCADQHDEYKEPCEKHAKK